MKNALSDILSVLSRRFSPKRYAAEIKNATSDPNLLILRAAKAGTTTLFDLLKSLPGFSGSYDKEPRYFSMDYYYQQGPAWYHAQFDQQPSAIKFEATPHYIYFPSVPERVYSYQRAASTEMKFIVLLREPAARCYSAWNMERSFHQNRSAEIIENVTSITIQIFENHYQPYCFVNNSRHFKKQYQTI